MGAARPGPLSRRRFLRRAGLLSLGLSIWAACGGSDEHPRTTLDQTIVLDEEGNIVTGPGEPYEVRAELAQAQAGRENRSRSIIAFHHLSDFRIIDEESPLRAEWSDECEPPPSATAFRPHESLSVQAAAALIEAANAASLSPVTGSPIEIAFHTGNATNNAQFNELRWFIDLMDGKPVYADSGAIGYQGVQTESPEPAYPDLLESAQRPFTPIGLHFPWYSVIGNRDVLVEGNFPPNEQATRFAVGAQKIMQLGPDALDAACASDGAPGSLTSADIFNDPETVIRGVGSDANRRLLTPRDWMAEHFATDAPPGPAGHGFAPGNVDTGRAYYVVEQGGVAFIVVDTVNDAGFSAGSIDADQFKWLEQQLVSFSSEHFDAQNRLVAEANEDRLIVVVSHHPPEEMLNPFAGSDGKKRYNGNDLEALLHRYPNVVLHIAGHTLQQRVTPKPDPGESGRGAYWQVVTGGPLDAPMQGRMLELVDNEDGTLSVFSTVYDSAAPIKPGDAKDPTPEDGQDESLLAALARQLAAGDPQQDPQAGGLQPSDRNAELIVVAPFDLMKLPTPTHGAGPEE